MNAITANEIGARRVGVYGRPVVHETQRSAFTPVLLAVLVAVAAVWGYTLMRGGLPF